MIKKSSIWLMFAVFGLSSAVEGMWTNHDFRLGIPLFICSVLLFMSSESYEEQESREKKLPDDFPKINK